MKKLITRPDRRDIWTDFWPTPFEFPFLENAPTWFDFPTSLESSASERFWAPTNVIEEDNEYEVSVEVPGFPKEKIEVEVVDHGLQISGEHEEISEDKKKKLRKQKTYKEERSYRSFSRFISLPPDANLEKPECSIKDGILTVKVPKSKEKSSGRKLLQVKG
ncbi:MAG TPA: Hsp20 family protein [Candidatus Gracilibacteria bacterium]